VLVVDGDGAVSLEVHDPQRAGDAGAREELGAWWLGLNVGHQRIEFGAIQEQAEPLPSAKLGVSSVSPGLAKGAHGSHPSGLGPQTDAHSAGSSRANG